MKSLFSLTTVVVSLLSLAVASAAHAGTINVILADMDISYSGAMGTNGSLFDVVAFVGGNLNPVQSDPLGSATFELNGAAPPASGGNNTIMSGPGHVLYGDLRIEEIGASLAKNVFLSGVGNNGGAFGFDFFSQTGDKLRIALDSVDMLVSDGVFFFTGAGTVVDQDLPFGLAFDTSLPVTISYTATLPAVQAGSSTAIAAASGALTISGTDRIPEPSTALLLLIGGLATLSLGAVRS